MTFSVAESYIKERRTINIMNTLLMVLTIVIIFVLTTILRGEAISTTAIVIIGVVVGIILIEMAVMTVIILKRIRQMSIHMTQPGLLRVNGKKEELIPYEQIESVLCVYLTSGRLRLIKVKTSGKIKKMNIIGMNDMTAIRMAFSSRIGADKVLAKRVKIDWYSPRTNVIVYFVTIAVISPIMFLAGEIYQYLNHILLAGIGIYLIAFKPSSKYYGQRFRPMEIGFGILMLALQLLNLALIFIL